MSSIAEITSESVTRLKEIYEEREAMSVVKLILREILEMNNTELAIYKSQGIDEENEKAIKTAVKRSAKGEPVQYILGHTDFAGFKILVDKNVLIPRPETEELVQWVRFENNISGMQILDACTGSGCIAIALEKLMNNTQVTAIDISKDALKIARENAEELKANTKFIQMNVLDEKSWGNLSSFDIIVSNPPYVLEKEKSLMHENVLKYEPEIALFVPNEDPLLFYKKIGAMAKQKLKVGGSVYFEINEEYGKEVKFLLEKTGFKNVEIKQDIHGKDRFVRGLKMGR